jgi:hypothetical protein
MLGPAASGGAPTARSLPVRNGRFTLARADRCFFGPPPPGATGWPLAPTGRAQHIWAFGTWRDSTGYYQAGPFARSHLGAAYVWHVGGPHGLHTQLYPDGKYQYCVQALTIEGVRGTRCTAVVIQD